jgi:hypothetical protein
MVQGRQARTMKMDLVVRVRVKVRKPVWSKDKGYG